MPMTVSEAIPAMKDQYLGGKKAKKKGKKRKSLREMGEGCAVRK